jgi:hypothetical protein
MAKYEKDKYATVNKEQAVKNFKKKAREIKAKRKLSSLKQSEYSEPSDLSKDDYIEDHEFHSYIEKDPGGPKTYHVDPYKAYKEKRIPKDDPDKTRMIQIPPPLKEGEAIDWSIKENRERFQKKKPKEKFKGNLKSIIEASKMYKI